MYCWWHSEYRCDCFNEIRNKITGNRKGFARIHLRTESVDRYRILKLSKQKWRDHSLIMICVSLARAPHYCRCLTSVIGSHAYSSWSRDNCAWPRDRLRGPTGKTKVEQAVKPSGLPGEQKLHRGVTCFYPGGIKWVIQWAEGELYNSCPPENPKV